MRPDMSTEKTYNITSNSPEDTEKLAARLGASLRGGEVIELVSDLGGGKTTFVRGLARGMGIDDHVASPSFTLSKVYASPTKSLHHFDLYRLTEPGLIAHELHDILGDESIVTVVEWAEAVAHVLPDSRLKISIQNKGENKREISIIYPDSLGYVIESLVSTGNKG